MATTTTHTSLPSNPTPRIYLTEIRVYIAKDIYKNVCSSTFVTTQMPSIVEWINHTKVTLYVKFIGDVLCMLLLSNNLQNCACTIILF